MSSRFYAFIACQILLSVTAAEVDRPGSLLHGFVAFGVTAAQFALVGIWVATGNVGANRRYSVAAALGGGLCVLTLLRTSLGGWDLLLAFLRAPVLAGVVLPVRRARNLAWRRNGVDAPERLFRLSLKQLFVLTLIFSGMFAIGRALSSYGGPFYEMLLLILVILLGVGGALASVIAAGLSLGKCDSTSALIGGLAIASLAVAFGFFGLWQTDSPKIAWQWFMMPIVEAIVTGFSIAVLRWSGYGLAAK